MELCKVTIKDKEYRFYKMTGRTSFRVFRKLSSLFGLVFQNASFGADLDQSSLISGVLFALGDDEFDEISELLMDGVTVEGEDLNIDRHFQGNISSMIELMIAIIQENYADFFTESGTKGIIQRITGIFPKALDSSPSNEDSKE